MKKLLILCCLFLAPCAFAYQDPKDYDYYALEEYGLKSDTTRVEIYGGLSQPEGDWTHNGTDVRLGNTGFSAGLAFVRNITPVFAIGIDANYTGLASGDYITTTSSSSLLTPSLPGIVTPVGPGGIVTTAATDFPSIHLPTTTQTTYKYSTGIATGLITGRVNFFPAQKTRLYVPFGAGLGHMFVKQKFVEGSHSTTNSTSWAMMLGLGLEFDIDETIIFGVEGRYNLMDLQDKLGHQIGKSRYHYMTGMFKIGCRF